MQNKIISIFWGPDNPPTQDFAKCLNAPFFKIHYLQHQRPFLAPIRYTLMFIKTLIILFQQKPAVVFVVNTPVFAPLSVWLYCRISGSYYIMDIHGHSFWGWKWSWCKPLQRALARRALVNLVDHSEHKKIFETWGANILMLERPPIKPPVNDRGTAPLSNSFEVTVINTFAGDEPLEPVLDAAAHLPEVRFFILGDTNKAPRKMLEKTSDNVVFPGYLLAEQYWNRLYASNAIMTLTKTPYSLVSGGIEGMAVRKPLILSRQPALTDYFTKGTIFVDHSVESIVSAVQQIQAQEERLTQEISELAVEKRQRWESVFQELRERCLGITQR